MLSIPRYRLSEEKDDASRTIVYRAVRETNLLSLVIKLLKNLCPSLLKLGQFCNQYTISKNFKYSGIIQITYSLEPYKNGYVLLMEDFGGISLKDYFGKNNHVVSLQEFLQIAIAQQIAVEKHAGVIEVRN